MNLVGGWHNSVHKDVYTKREADKAYSEYNILTTGELGEEYVSIPWTFPATFLCVWNYFKKIF